jgi:uncharacterized protein with GYD domain
MPTYIVLARFRDRFFDSIQGAAERSAAGRRTAEALGCKVLGAYMTTGRYDVVRIFEAPDDVAMAKVTLALNAIGHEKTETLHAFSGQQMGEILASVAGR